MMRLCCLSLSFKPEFAAKQMDDLRFIDLCADLGLDGVDFNLGSLRSLEKDHLRKIKRACVAHGLTIACLGVSNDFGRPAKDQDAVQQQIRDGIETAQFLGGQVEDVGPAEGVAGRVDATGLEDEVGLLDVHGATVDAEHEVAARLGGRQGPEAGVAAHVEHALAAQRAAAQAQQRRPQVGAALAVAVDHFGVVNGGFVTVEVEFVMPAREGGDAFGEVGG